MASRGLSQFIGAFWSGGQQIRNSKYGNHIKSLRNVAHRYHLEQPASGR
jgi:hypothetical protein